MHNHNRAVRRWCGHIRYTDTASKKTSCIQKQDDSICNSLITPHEDLHITFVIYSSNILNSDTSTALIVCYDVNDNSIFLHVLYCRELKLIRNLKALWARYFMENHYHCGWELRKVMLCLTYHSQQKSKQQAAIVPKQKLQVSCSWVLLQYTNYYTLILTLFATLKITTHWYWHFLLPLVFQNINIVRQTHTTSVSTTVLCIQHSSHFIQSLTVQVYIDIGNVSTSGVCCWRESNLWLLNSATLYDILIDI